MSDRRLPSTTHRLPERWDADVDREEGGTGAADGGAAASSWADGGGPALRAAAVGVAAIVGLLLALAAASSLGDTVRRAVLVEVDRSPLGSEPAYTDAPEEAARFFAGRDSVTVRVPWDMTVGEFLGLYHLETNAAARRALTEQLGAADDADPLREGDEVVLTLTLTRPER